MLKKVASVGLALAMTISGAQAHPYYAQLPTFDRHAVEQQFTYETASAPAVKKHHKTRGEARHKRGRPRIDRVPERYAREATIMPHPAGCPRVAFCGCGVALHVFGKIPRELWLAANWFRFPRAVASAGMVAVRQHHVMAILTAHGDGTATVYDPNSGGHLTRIHRRSLAGYVIVNPNRKEASAIP